MIEIQDGSSSLAKVGNGGISKNIAPFSVGKLELALLSRFPREDAEDWDRMGLVVGDPAATVEGVAVALDPTSAALESAKRAGANVLLTHHPVFLDPPEVLAPTYGKAPASGVTVFNAVRHGIALMNFHTALDVSVEATRMLPQMLNLEFDGLLETLKSNPDKGYGQVCSVRDADKPFKLAHLAARCTSVFGRAPRVWGDFDLQLDRVVVANGSAGNIVDACINKGVSCLVCGEIRYHAALDAAQAGLAIVELGHDVSELHLAALLAQAAVDAGVPQDRVSIVDQAGNWEMPDSTRI